MHSGTFRIPFYTRSDRHYEIVRVWT